MTTPHLDEEQLSTHFDGESGVDAADHLRSCPPCQNRLARLDTVASLLGTPVAPPPHGVQEAAVAAARAAWTAERGGHGDQVRSEVSALDRRPHLPRWALPVAAAAAALLLSVPVLSATRDTGTETSTTSAGDQGATREGGSDEIAGTDGGDLGDQTD
ncbi:MAG: hypothetical protein ABIS21_06995, partial [Acidimicrobiales bacterium]